MIIVNQNQNIVINFSQMLSIYVQEKNVQVLINCVEDALILGKYKTEERAKEVLSEIMQSYLDSENYKYVNGLMRAEELNKLQKGLVYEMPEE